MVLSGVLFIFSFLLWSGTWRGVGQPILVTAVESPALSAVRWGAGGLVALATVLLVDSLLKKRGTLWRILKPGFVVPACLGFAWIVLLVIRVATLQATPEPRIDVFVTNTFACDYLLAGNNPYAAWYPDIYEGASGYAPGFFYWPTYLYWATPFRALFEDVRFATLAADLLVSGLLLVAGIKLGLSRPAAALVPLVWLSHPVSLMVLELAWIDPVLILGIAGTALCLILRRWLALGIVLGLVAATKQYGGLVGLLSIAAVFAVQRKATPRVVVSAAVTWVAMLGPYVLLDWRSLYERTVGVYIHTPMRPDALSLVAMIRNEWGVEVPGFVLLPVYLAITIAACVWLARSDRGLHRWAGVLALCYGAIFLLGKLAFCNYYYVVAFLVLLATLLSVARDLGQSKQTGLAMEEAS